MEPYRIYHMIVKHGHLIQVEKIAAIENFDEAMNYARTHQKTCDYLVAVYLNTDIIAVFGSVS